MKPSLQYGGRVRSRGRSVPKSLGRQVEVFSIETRRPIAPRRQLTNNTVTSTVAKRLPSSRASSAAHRSQASIDSARSRHGDEACSVNKQDVLLTNGPQSASSARRNVKKTQKEGIPQKFITPEQILEQSQESDFYKVYEIDLHGAEITEIPDLEKFRKLRVADLSGNHIQRIDHLEFTQDLRELKLYDNEISKLEGLDSLKELCHLQLQHNQIHCLDKSLSTLTKLKVLRLDSNRLHKLETKELISCARITYLDLSNNRLDNLSALNYLPNLEELFVSGNCLQKVADLHGCKHLQEIDLSRNLLTELSGIAGLPNLQILDVSDNKLDSLSSLGKLKNLEDLNVSKNRFSVLTGWGISFPRVQILDLSDNRIEAWEQVCTLVELADLVELFLAGNPVTLEDGECPSYHLKIQHVLPALEIVDGAHVKRSEGKAGVPLMRPISACSVISVRQVDTQLKSIVQEQEALQKNIVDRFASLKTLVESLPTCAPNSSQNSLREKSNSLPATPSSRCSSRSRIQEAQLFASSMVDDNDGDDNENDANKQ